MDQDLFTGEYRNRRRRREPSGGDGLFGWAVFILLLIGFAFACWIGTYYIFGRPENPKSYEILKKLKKVEAPKRFALTEAPNGEFLSAQKLFDRYATMSRLDLERENSDLLRCYIKNYDAIKRLVPYVVGRFNIIGSYELTPKDVFPSGVVAIAQSVDQPQILIEHVFSAEPENVPALKKLLQPGLDIRLEKTLDLSAIIQIKKLDSGHIEFTCVPLLYGSYQMRQGTGRFSLEPPAELNLAGGIPIIRGERFDIALKRYSEQQRKTNAAQKVATSNKQQPASQPTPSGPELVRSEEEAVPSPTPEAVPSATPVATAVAVASAPPKKPAISPTPTPVTVAANVSPTPAASPKRTPSPTPTAAPSVTPTPASSPEGVPLQPFLTAVATPTTATTAARSWRTYDPGRMPIGRLVDAGEAADMAERGVSGETIYLRGDFSVTASGEYQAILRPKGGALSNMINRGNGTRIIVEFPAGITPPAEGSTFSRDQQRPFQITDVRRGEDGQLNIYVREVTKP